MNIGLWVRIGSRNIMRNKRRSLIMLMAMTIGLAGVIWFMGFMNAWLDQMVDNVIRSGNGQMQIKAQGAFERAGSTVGFDPQPALDVLEQHPELKAAQRVRGRGLLVGPNKSWPIQVVGIDPPAEKQVSDWPQGELEGEYLKYDDHGKMLVGRKMVRRFDTRVGKKLVLYSQSMDASEDFGSGAFRIKGVYRSNSPELDDSTVFIALPEAQSLFSLAGQVSEIAIIGAQDELLAQTVDELRPAIEAAGLEIKSWRELSPMIVQMIEFSDKMMWIFYLVIFIAMAFGIINVLLIAVLERRREFGVLRALGTPPQGLSFSIIFESLSLALLACLIGDAIGVLSVHYFHVHGLDLSYLAEGMEYVGMSAIVFFRVTVVDVLVADAMLLLIVLLASIYPAVKARRGRPAELLRS
ncbi:MAG: ABC transporter permease [Candidatus Alcyoniella australis]|nr:ABC transporter permease [Candidatus Alcyoniella australis]